MSRPIHLSASAVREFLHCPNCFRIAYIEGVRPAVEAGAFRMGTSYHAMHEVYRTSLRAGSDRDAAFAAAFDHLNKRYETCPPSVDLEEWEEERQQIAGLFAGHAWLYQNEPLDVIASEIPFRLPLFHPLTGLPLPESEVVRVGKIDELIRVGPGRVAVSDYKTTSKSIEDGSEYWDHLKLDTQLSMYVLAARDMHRMGLLEPYGVGPEDEIVGAFYDVARKPAIRPKKLSQADTAAFVEMGTYFGQNFRVQTGWTQKTCDPPIYTRHVVVDGVPAQVEEMKKGYVIRETSAMYGARLLGDIYERPSFYYNRREVPRTDRDLANFRRELYGIYQTMKAMRDGGWWYRNDQHDNAAAHGQYGQLCYHDVDLSDGHTPEGFKRIFEEEAA